MIRDQLFELIVEVFCIGNIVLYQLYKTSILVFLTIFTSIVFELGKRV